MHRMRSPVQTALTLILALVFTGVSALAFVEEPVRIAGDIPLVYSAAGGSCCVDEVAEATCCCDSGQTCADCCDDMGPDCGSCLTVESGGQQTALSNDLNHHALPAESSSLVQLPDQRPEDAIGQPIEHVPRHSRS